MPSSPLTNSSASNTTQEEVVAPLPSPKDKNVKHDGLTDVLLAHTTSIALNPKNKDKIIQMYLDANKEERMIITKMYSQAFEDPIFVQSLIRAGTIRVASEVEREFENSNGNNGNHQQHNHQGRQSNNSKNNNKSSPSSPTVAIKKKLFGSMKDDEKSSQSSSHQQNESGQRRQRTDDDDDEDKNTENENNGNKNETNSQMTNSLSSKPRPKEDLQARCRTLRKEIDETVCALTGRPGPHKIRFGIARTQSEIDKIIDLFSQQFVYPGARELKSTYVKLPKRVSTRHRSIRTGNFCWYIQYVNSGEICCAATVNLLPVHEGCDDRIVFEIPLYATAAGFKRLGLARLLNAAIQELSIFMKAELILISADQNAVPFWTNKNLGGGGYTTLTKGQKDSYQFMYENQCQLFGDTTMLCWSPPKGADALASGLLQDALEKTPKFVLDGPARLPVI